MNVLVNDVVEYLDKTKVECFNFIKQFLNWSLMGVNSLPHFFMIFYATRWSSNDHNRNLDDHLSKKFVFSTRLRDKWIPWALKAFLDGNFFL